jgi:hypothetical protein
MIEAHCEDQHRSREEKHVDRVTPRRLRELGWVEARTITIEYRWAEGRS